MRRKGRSACPAEIAFDFSLLAFSLRVSLQSSLYQMVLVHREGRERGGGRSRCRCGDCVSGKGKAGRVNAWPTGSLILLLVFWVLTRFQCPPCHPWDQPCSLRITEPWGHRKLLLPPPHVIERKWGSEMTSPSGMSPPRWGQCCPQRGWVTFPRAHSEVHECWKEGKYKILG